MIWKQQPDKEGLYLFTEEMKNWDIPKVAKVDKSTYGDGSVVRLVRFWESRNDVMLDCVNVTGFWFGPLYTNWDICPIFDREKMS